MTSDTPRTDALIRPNGALATNLLEHARQMERELNSSNAEVKMLKVHLLKSLTIADQSIELWKETLDVAKQLKP
jgi:hypothetical protein